MFRGARMVTNYTLYALQDEHVFSAEMFEAADDVAAIETARARAMPMDGELWCDDRLVAFIARVPPAAPD